MSQQPATNLPAKLNARTRHQAAVNRQQKRKLPPHLLPGISRRRKTGNLVPWLVGIGATLAIMVFVFTIIFAVSTAMAAAGAVREYRDVNEGLPDAAGVVAGTFQTTNIYDRNGTLLQEVADPSNGWRTFVPFEDISQHLIDATVASEDATFWSHLGVEPFAIIRGATIIASGSGSSGGSTITQQLARALYPDVVNPLDYSVMRKVREAFIAIAIDKEFSKEDQITMYLNLIFYGQRSYGIEAASQTFFNKHAADLDLAESSLLAGLPQAPSAYDPTVFFDQAKIRQQYVLNQLVKYGYITRSEADAAFAQPLSIQDQNKGAIQDAPHFTEYVKQWIVQNYGPDALYNSGLNFYTSIDVDLQDRAEQIVANGVANLAVFNRNNGAAVAVVPWSGEILFMVGSANFNDPNIGGQVNYATAQLQPGSSIKPLVYASAFERGWNPGTIVMDTATEFPTGNPALPVYTPNNYSGVFNGAVSVRMALANSLNMPAVKAAEFATVDHVLDTARRLGYVNSLSEDAGFYGIAVALGSGEVQLVEHTGAYATLANNGAHVPLHPVIKVTDAQGNVIWDLYDDPSVTDPVQGIKAEYAYQITSILTDNDSRAMVFGTNNLFGNTASTLERPTAAKSGTTEEWRDLWTMGYSTAVAIGVWVGNTNAYGNPVGYLPEKDGIETAGPIWQSLMIEIHQNGTWSGLIDGPNGRPVNRAFSQPSGIYEGAVCAATGNAAVSGYSSAREFLVRDEGPALPCNVLSAYQREELDFALKSISENGGKYTGAAYDSIYRYRDVVMYGSDPGGSSSNAPTDDEPADSPPIVERD
ncbi:MAG: transglycosylase domain-containing protein [Thermomicrobiales bacterium]|nr:transglycosylase domain-containing protein [Thermomicrobiales bacterium]